MKKGKCVISVSNGKCNCLSGAVLRRQCASNKVLVQLFLSLFVWTNVCSAINTFEERVSKSVCHYPHLCYSSHLDPVYNGRLFTCSEQA